MYDRQSKEFEMTGVCGIYCAECELVKVKDDPDLMEYFLHRGYPAEKLPCPGCRVSEGNCPVIGEVCETYLCAREKNVGFCFECEDFPCDKLNPARDRADVLPHNLKTFNLCCIQNKGLEYFAREAAGIKEKYYKGKMEIGKGPLIK